MDAFDTGPWEALATALLGASAALVGLIFVGVSINLQQILKYPWLPSRAAEAVIELGAVLAASLLLLVPGQSSHVLGVELVVLGGAGATALVVMALRRRGLIDVEHRRRADAQASWGVLSMMLFAIAGVSLLTGAGGGLYWLVPAVLLSIGLAILNAWVLLIEINR